MKSNEPSRRPLAVVDRRALGFRIVKLRGLRGWKQVELARRAGLPPHSLSRIENGRRIPTLDEIAALRNVFGTDLEQLVFGASAQPAASSPAGQVSAEDLACLERLLNRLRGGQL